MMRFLLILVLFGCLLPCAGLAQNLVADPDTSNPTVGNELATGGANFGATLTDNVVGATATSTAGPTFTLGAGLPGWSTQMTQPFQPGQSYTLTLSGVSSSVAANIPGGDADFVLISDGLATFTMTGNTGTTATPGVFTRTFSPTTTTSTLTFIVSQSRGSMFTWTFETMVLNGPPKVPELDPASSAAPFLFLLGLVHSQRKSRGKR